MLHNRGMLSEAKSRIFITYAGPDIAHAHALHAALKAEGHAAYLDAHNLNFGDAWDTPITAALAAAELIVVLLSPTWKQHDAWYAHDEVARAVARARDAADRVRVVPAIMDHVKPVDLPSGLARLVPLRHADRDWSDTARRLCAVLDGRSLDDAPPPGDRISSAPRVSIGRLPTPGPHFVGRAPELAALDAAWSDDRTHLHAIIGIGGEGKSALVAEWLQQMTLDDWRGAARVYGWSFYSQGAGEDRQVSADLFVDQLLRWLDDPRPAEGDAYAKAARLAGLLREQKTLLVLDGIEPLQFGPGEFYGRIKDDALRALLRELRAEMCGLCVLTSRVTPEQMNDGGPVRLRRLPPLDPATGAEVLRRRGAQGAEAELRAAAVEVKGHALALNLLGGYVAMYARGDIQRRDTIDSLLEAEDGGGHARRVMHAYDRMLDPADRQALRVVGLFDRAAEPAPLAAVLAEPPIAGLTDALGGVEGRAWLRAVAHLRGLGLLLAADGGAAAWEGASGGAAAREGAGGAAVEPGAAGRGHDAPGSAGGEATAGPSAGGRRGADAIDAHPLVREHFGAEVERETPAAWQAAHARLYAHFAGAAEHQPDDLPGLEPLYRAVHHGCAAGRHQEALAEVFARRIRRGKEHYSLHKLGAYAADLAALAPLFTERWRRPHPALAPQWQAYALNEAAFALRALGRPAEAAAPMAAGLDLYVEQQHWPNAARAAGELSGLLLSLGRLDPARPAPGGDAMADGAIARARQAVAHADRSGDLFLRMYNRTALADALHQRGRLGAARALFAEAERLQRARQPTLHRLYSVQGYRYGDLLLADQPAEARRRAEWMVSAPWVHRFLLDDALYHLLLARAAHATAAGPADRALAGRHLDAAITGLRKAGAQQFLAPGLLHRAAFHRATGDPTAAARDLAEAREIAERAGLRLALTDAHLEAAHQALARADRTTAEAEYRAARDLVEATAYHRRDPDLAALAAALAAALDLEPPAWLGQADIEVDIPLADEVLDDPPRPGPLPTSPEAFQQAVIARARLRAGDVPPPVELPARLREPPHGTASAAPPTPAEAPAGAVRLVLAIAAAAALIWWLL